jgi:plasmid replication initiation protein
MSSPPGQALPQREQLDLFRALPGDMAPRDSQDLMAFPFFSLAKSRRTAPIDFRSGNVTIRVEGTQEHGIATIWDADVLIWAASQIVEARDAGLRPSRWIRATPYEILRFIGRGTSLNDYQRLKAALDRLQSTTVATSIRETTGRRLHRFSWINEWKELADASGTPLGIELILPDWFYAGVLDAALVLTIDPAYFRLKGGIERWLYRLVRKHGGGRSTAGNSTSDTCTAIRQRGRFSDFAYDLRALVARQSLPGYVRHRADAGRQHRAADLPARAARGTGITAGEPVDGLVLSGVPGIVLSGVRPRAIRSTKTPESQQRRGFAVLTYLTRNT